jgi:hypothetical protein
MNARRPSPALVVACFALIVALGGSAIAAIPDPSGEVHFCYSPKTGEVKVVTENQDDPDCQRRWKSFDIEALPDSLQSANGDFAVKATNTGVVLSGGGQSLRLDATGITVTSSAKVTVQGAGPVKVNGATVQLGGCGRPVARVGDPVAGNQIVSGSPTVSTC